MISALGRHEVSDYLLVRLLTDVGFERGRRGHCHAAVEW